ncbi:MAG: putative glycoside hydrolase [Armatimonadota bacterium]
MRRAFSLIGLLALIACTTCVREVEQVTAEPRQPKCLGVFGSPKLLWDRGEKLSDYHINAVFVGHAALKPEVIERCRREGARVYAEIGIFVGAKVAEEHPELWPINAQGQKMEKDGWYLGLCPNYNWYFQEKLDEVEGLAREYDIDGIWLDFIRFPGHWEVRQPRREQACFCSESLKDFSETTGIQIEGETTAQRADFILTHHRAEWTTFKCRRIAEFCRRAKQRLKKHRPQAVLGIFSVPWTEEDYDDAIHEIIAQDFALLAEHVDVFSPMSYHLMCGFPPEWVGQYNEYLVGKTGRDVWPIVQCVNQPEELPVAEFRQVLELGLSGGATGVQVFTLKGLVEEEEKLGVVKQVYARP